jgi:hypothetical protein
VASFESIVTIAVLPKDVNRIRKSSKEASNVALTLGL